MSPHKFRCPKCHAEVEADDDAAGKIADCPHCGKRIMIPRNAAAPQNDCNDVASPEQSSTALIAAVGKQTETLKDIRGLLALMLTLQILLLLLGAFLAILNQ